MALVVLPFIVSSKKTIIFVMVAAVVAVLMFPTLNAQEEPIAMNCGDNDDNYTTNGTYYTNLNTLISSLSLNGSINGFAEGTVGSIPDRVYGLVLCRGDIDNITCKTCLHFASQDVLDRCPFRKAVTIWYSDCLLRYSNQMIASRNGGGQVWYEWNTQNVSSDVWPRFNQSLVKMMVELIQYATNNTSALPPPLFATGEIEFDSEFPIIYGLVQCTRDLLPDTCNQCLMSRIGDLSDCCYMKIGGKVLAQSCNIRYEVGTFFSGTPRVYLPGNSTATAPAPSLILPSPPLTALPPILPPSTKSTNTTADGNKEKKSTGIILAIAIPTGIAFILLLFCLACCLRKRITKKRLNSRIYQPDASAESLHFDLKTLRTATNDFSESNKLGEGGFGVVYKGNLEDGQEIAVKRLSTSSGQGLDQLRNEVFLLAKLQHKNLVKILGVCLEEGEKLIIYEYIPNRSLDTILFDPIKKEQLAWERRISIIEGISRGILYLHEESQVKIIHRDLKASNILLDAKMTPKISDFGLARLFCEDQTHASTKIVVGTFGYMSPEYAMRGQFSNKSDVFSFGVLVLEIITGKKNSDFVGSENSANLIDHVWEHWSSGEVGDIVDPSLAGNYSHGEALRCIQIGLLCAQENPSDRPTMSEIVLMLSSHSVSVRVPSSRPSFLGGLNFREKNHEYYQGISSQSTTRSVMYTPNDVSITELDAR